MTEVVPVDDTAPKDEAAYRAHVLKQLLLLQQEHGEAHVQKALQQEIQMVKKRQAEVLALDKQLRQQRRETDQARMQLHSYQDLKKKGEALCQTLKTTIKKRDELTKAMVEEMKENREKAIESTREQVQSFIDSSEARKKALDETLAENAKLHEEAEALQESFKQEYERFQADLHTMFTPSEEIKALQDAADEVNALQEELKRKETQNSGCVTGAMIMEKQLEWYEEQFKQFEEVLVDPESVKVILEKQRVAGDERLNEGRKELEKVKGKRIALEEELQKLRVDFATLTKKLVKVESDKKAAEKRCRQAQAALNLQK